MDLGIVEPVEADGQELAGNLAELAQGKPQPLTSDCSHWTCTDLTNIGRELVVEGACWAGLLCVDVICSWSISLHRVVACGTVSARSSAASSIGVLVWVIVLLTDAEVPLEVAPVLNLVIELGQADDGLA